MKRIFVNENFFWSVLGTLLAVTCYLTTASAADYKDSVNHHGKCMEEKYREKEKCNEILGKAYGKIGGKKEDWKAYNVQMDMAIKCHSQAESDFDRCTDPKVIRTFIKDKKWRQEHKKELKALADKYEADGDVCSDKAESGIKKCNAKYAPEKKEGRTKKQIKKAEKGHAKCLAAVAKKDKKCFRKATKKFLKELKKLKPPK